MVSSRSSYRDFADWDVKHERFAHLTLAKANAGTRLDRSLARQYEQAAEEVYGFYAYWAGLYARKIVRSEQEMEDFLHYLVGGGADGNRKSVMTDLDLMAKIADKKLEVRPSLYLIKAVKNTALDYLGAGEYGYRVRLGEDNRGRDPGVLELSLAQSTQPSQPTKAKVVRDGEAASFSEPKSAIAAEWVSPAVVHPEIVAVSHSDISGHLREIERLLSEMDAWEWFQSYVEFLVSELGAAGDSHSALLEVRDRAIRFRAALQALCSRNRRKGIARRFFDYLDIDVFEFCDLGEVAGSRGVKKSGVSHGVVTIRNEVEALIRRSEWMK